MNTSRAVIRLLSFILTLVMILSAAACGNKESSKPKKKTNKKQNVTSSDNTGSGDGETSDSNTGSENDFFFDDTSSEEMPEIDLSKIHSGNLSDENSDGGGNNEDEKVIFDIEDMFDSDENTYWSPNSTEKTTISFSLKKEYAFNAITFTEQRAYITDMTLEALVGGKYIQICKLDEMGRRTCILDDTVKAKDFRMSVIFTNSRGGISEIKFENKTGFANGKNFRNVGYFTCSSLDDMRRVTYDKLPGYTDIIVFDYGSWNKNGDFLWASKHTNLDETHFAATLKEVRAVPHTENLKIWFCLQNYDTKTTQNTDELFATKEACDKLTAFSVNMCEKYNLCGIDIDYEYPRTQLSWENYDKFLNQLAEALHKKGYKLSVALSSGGGALSKETIAKIDYANIMAYDNFDLSGRHSSFALARTSYMSYIDKGFKPEQLVMGLPFYSRTMDSTHGYGPGIEYIAERWRGGLKPWVNIVTNKKWVYYFNGANMIRDKVYFSMSNNLSGVFNWAMSSDIANNNRYGAASLGQTIIDTIKRFSK